MPTPGDESCCVQALTEVTRDRFSLTFAPGCRCPYPFVILRSGGSALVRRRIQTPSVATVLSVVQPEGEVVLGASPPARRFAKRSGGPVGRKTADRQGPAGLYVDIASDVDAARLIPGNPARFARHDDFRGFRLLPESVCGRCLQSRHRRRLVRLASWRRHAWGSTVSAGSGGTSSERTSSVAGTSRSSPSTISGTQKRWRTSSSTTPSSVSSTRTSR